MRHLALLGCLILAGCVTETPPDTPLTPGGSLADRLGGTRAVLTEPGDPEPVVMMLRRDGTGQTEYFGLTLTYNWQAEGDRLCFTDLRLGGVLSDDPAPQCSVATLTGNTLRLAEIGGDGTVMQGPLTPL